MLPSWLGLKKWSNCIRHFDSLKKLVDFDHFYEGKSNKISFRSVKIPYSPFIQFHKPHFILHTPRSFNLTVFRGRSGGPTLMRAKRCRVILTRGDPECPLMGFCHLAVGSPLPKCRFSKMGIATGGCPFFKSTILVSQSAPP